MKKEIKKQEILPWGKKLTFIILFSIAAIIGMSFAWKGNTIQSNQKTEITNQAITSVTVTDEIEEGLLLMREEEKLAHDVYITLYEKWGESIFTNIANSEQKHTDSIQTLLDRYGLEDPVVDDTVGVFTNEVFANLYNELVEKGNESLSKALEVGAIIEDLDIKDLNEKLEVLDEESDIYKVYTNLRNASYNHLTAFVSNIEANGGTRDSEYIDDAQLYQEVRNGQKGNKQRGNSQGGNTQRGSKQGQGRYSNDKVGNKTSGERQSKRNSGFRGGDQSRNHSFQGTYSRE